MSILCVNPEDHPLWQTLVEQHRSDVFQSPGWLRVLTDTYDFEVHARVLLDESNQPIAGIPFCRVTDLIGSRMVTLPFSDYCDPLVATADQWQCLSDSLLAEQSPMTVRCLHTTVPLADERFTLGNRARWHGLDLRPDLDILWRNLPDATKRAIKKARREGVVVRVAEGKADLRTFFDMHLRIRKYKYHLLAQPYRFFERIWEHFLEKQKGVLLLATYQDAVIGGVLFLEWKHTLYYKFNASAQDHLAFRPNDLLIWEGIQHGKSKGYTALDFGLSDWDQEGLIHYKRKFATEEKTISFLRHMPDGIASQHEQQMRSLINQLTTLFIDESAPDHLTRRAGEVLYRYFT